MKNTLSIIGLLFMVFGLAQSKCNNRILKLNNGSIEMYDLSGINKTSSILSDVVDFDCNDKEIAAVKRDGSIVFYDFIGNTKFSCNNRNNTKVKYIDEKTYVLTKTDGTIRKYQVCNDLGAF